MLISYKLVDYYGSVPEWLQAICWTYANFSSIKVVGTNFSEIFISVQWQKIVVLWDVLSIVHDLETIKNKIIQNLTMG